MILTNEKQDKKVAVITDASSPAAEAIAKKLEGKGMIVVRNYPREKMGDGDNDFRFSYDTTSIDDMKQLLTYILEDIGTVIALIHTDNVIIPSSIEQIDEETFKTALDFNTKTAFVTTKVFAEYMGEQGTGAVVYLSSIHGEKPTGSAFSYSVSKGAVKMLCKEMALFYGRKGVRSNLIEVDYIEEDRELLDSNISPFNYDAETKIPLKRLANPEDCAGAAAFLISEDAAFINGAEIRIDGGHVLYYGDR
ncbi:MAG TPA: SDR family oxidoreductase [Clostridia bacterium]|nr:SDR family oxidoreductase [Clostridia bacterium]